MPFRSKKKTCSMDELKLDKDSLDGDEVESLDDVSIPQHLEPLYRTAISSVVGTLGALSSQDGFTNEDLLRKIREIFDVEEACHRHIVKQERLKYLVNHNVDECLLNLRVIEAKDLKAMDSNGFSDPYCLISLVKPKKGGKSQGMSPYSKRKSSFDCSHVKRTKVVEKTLSPVWNEEFEFEVSDLSHEVLEIYVWDMDEGTTLMQHFKDLEGPCGLKNLFRNVRQTIEFGKPMDDFIGQIKIPVQDIPAYGLDKWFDIVKRKDGKEKKTGKIRVRVELRHNTVRDEHDSAESDQVSGTSVIDEYHMLASIFYEYTINQLHADDKIFSGQLNPVCERSLDLLAIPNRISKLSRDLVHLVCLLEIASDKSIHCDISGNFIREAVQKSEISLEEELSFSNNQQTENAKFSDIELCKFDKATTGYMQHIIKNVDDLPPLFPPSEETIMHFENKASLIITLLNSKIWPTNPSAKKGFSSLITERIQADINSWLRFVLDGLHLQTHPDSVLFDVEKCCSIVLEIVEFSSVKDYVKNTFDKLDVDYYKTSSFCIDKKLIPSCRQVIADFDRWQKRYQGYDVNIKESSALSMKFYLILKKLRKRFQENVAWKHIYRLSITSLYDWFTESLIFWLQTFKAEGTRRVLKAIEIDKDVVQVTTLVKYSHSCVDILQCFHQIINDWHQIKFCGADNNFIAVMKITDTICDGARLYTDKICSILETNSFYASEDDQKHFDVTDQLCITLNNIEQVRNYIVSNIPELLSWSAVAEDMAATHENEDLTEQVTTTLTELVADADKDILNKCCYLFHRIAALMSKEIYALTLLFTQKEPSKRNAIDLLLDYLETNLSLLFAKLMDPIFPRMVSQLWTIQMDAFESSLLHGRQPEYYITMEKRLDTLRDYFLSNNVPHEFIANCPLHTRLMRTLYSNSQSTSELMHSYYETICLNIETPMDYFGHVAVKIAYKEETRETVKLFVKIASAENLPGLDRSKKSDPYVILQLCPVTIFPNHKSQRTKVVKQCLNPLFNETFEFASFPFEYLNATGAALHLIVMDYDYLVADDYAGEIFVSLSGIRQIFNKQTCDDVPALMLPLKRAHLDEQPESFQIMRDRALNCDVIAKSFYDQRAKYLKNHPERTDIDSGKKPICDRLKEVAKITYKTIRDYYVSSCVEQTTASMEELDLITPSEKVEDDFDPEELPTADERRNRFAGEYGGHSQFGGFKGRRQGIYRKGSSPRVFFPRQRSDSQILPKKVSFKKEKNPFFPALKDCEND